MTIIKSIEEITIYESPDGGKTIYARKGNEKERTLVSKDVGAKDYDRWIAWRQILLTSKEVPALAAIIEQAEMCYELVKEERS